MYIYLLFRDLPPSQGGKYVGFGSTPMKKEPENDYWGLMDLGHNHFKAIAKLGGVDDSLILY